MLILDTSAWIEYFLKTDKGKKVKNFLETQQCHTSLISIAELSQWALKNGKDGRDIVRYAAELSQIIQISGRIAFLAGELNVKRKMKNKKWGMVDSIILATAEKYGLKIITKDNDYRDLTNAQII